MRAVEAIGMSLSRALLFVLLSGLNACGFDSSYRNIELSGPEQEKAIIGGQQLDDGDPLVSHVVGLYDRRSGKKCSASIVSEKYVLTAAHCVLGKAEDYLLVFATDVQGVLNSKDEVLRRSKLRRLEDIVVHSEYRKEDLDSPDLALIKISGILPEGYRPLSLAAENDELVSGQEVILFGFGHSKVNKEAIVGDAEVNKDLVDMGIVHCDLEKKKCYLLDYFGSGFLRSASAVINKVGTSFMSVDESLGKGTCKGDSGGPALIRKQTAYIQVGITTSGSMTCDKTGFYIILSKFRYWIDRIIQ